MTLFRIRQATALLALAAALPACAQKAAPTAQPAAAATHAPGDADPALWVVKDRDTTVYLFGTIHVLKPGLSWFDDAVKQAFDKSGTLMLEMVEPDTATMQGIVKSGGFDPAGPPLSAQLSPKARVEFQKAIADSGVPGTAFEHMKPWLAAVTLSLGPVGKQGYDAANGPEQVLTTAANAEHKPVAGLETAQQQIGFFSGLSQKAQIAFLESTLDELPTANDQMGRMVADWARGDPDALAKEMNDELKDSPEVERTLLIDRNRNWAGWIANRLKAPGTVFVAVGAGHLAGPNSVQNQLAKLGIKAERVKY